MRSKLITLMAAGAMVLALAPAASAADCTGNYSSVGVGGAATTSCTTAATFVVTDGVTIFAPATINLGTGFPGQTVTTTGWLVDYVTNIANLKLTVASTPLTYSTFTIPNTNLYLGGSKSAAADLSAPRTIVASMLYSTGLASNSSGAFSLTVYVPSVGANAASTNYAGVLTFAAAP